MFACLNTHRSSRSRASSAAGGKPQGDIAAQADIEQPPAMTPRHLQQQQKLQERRSAGGGKKTFMGTMTALLGEIVICQEAGLGFRVWVEGFSAPSA